MSLKDSKYTDPDALRLRYLKPKSLLHEIEELVEGDDPTAAGSIAIPTSTLGSGLGGPGGGDAGGGGGGGRGGDASPDKFSVE